MSVLTKGGHPGALPAENIKEGSIKRTTADEETALSQSHICLCDLPAMISSIQVGYKWKLRC